MNSYVCDKCGNDFGNSVYHDEKNNMYLCEDCLEDLFIKKGGYEKYEYMSDFCDEQQITGEDTSSYFTKLPDENEDNKYDEFKERKN